MVRIFTPHVATIHPAKLVRGLARVVERMGVRSTSKARSPTGSPAACAPPGPGRASWVVPAVEGYANTLAPLGRYQLPVQSLIVATEPLPKPVWEEIGLNRQGQAFSESSRQVTYGQRTADNRLVFGARGGYQFGGRLRHNFDLTPAEIELRRYLFCELFPQLKHVRISHSWGGNLGMSRRFQPHMLCATNRVASPCPAGMAGRAWAPATWVAGPWPT
jgi:glycine/D-amino acid oxidase-like deaminating enzyme